jgi:hypothetical protein
MVGTSLSRPWLFVVVGIMGLYGLRAVFATLVFRGVGVSGAPPMPKPFLEPLEVKSVLPTVAFVVLGVLALWGLRSLFAKVRSIPRHAIMPQPGIQPGLKLCVSRPK